LSFTCSLSSRYLVRVSPPNTQAHHVHEAMFILLSGGLMHDCNQSVTAALAL
jgi:hypothetical protein